MSKEQPEAIRLAELIDYHAPIDFDGHLAQAASELRRLHADGEAKDRRIAHLEATASANYGRGHADAHSMLSERIAELEQRNSDLHEDVQRFKKHALNEKAARLELERQLEEAHKALHDAATSLNTISELAGYPKKGGVETFMDTFLDVRLYARSRHQVARDAINAYYLEPHVKQEHEAIRKAMQKGKP